VHYAEGGRIFTYVLTLDAHLRFTETGKEFGIDLLSKHTMHSDVSIYIAYSGEFFVRRIKHHHLTSSDPSSSSSPTLESPEEPHERTSTPSKDPSHYELFIDNDSGTYRPNAKYLPTLKEFMGANFPGLKINTLDCQADAERMGKLKNEQRETKKREGHNITYMQANLSMSSLSSSDEEELDARAEELQSKGKVAKKVDGIKQPKQRLMQWIDAQTGPQDDGPSQEKTPAPVEGPSQGDKAVDAPSAERPHGTTESVEQKAVPTEEQQPGNVAK
jgi:hypothetical protein